MLAINASVPARTVSEFIAHARANPGRINMGSAGIGSTGHLAGELFKIVPYSGNAPALTDLIAGQIEVLFPSLGSSIEYVKTGKLRALAGTGATRSDAVPDLPTVAETLPGYQAASFYGIGAPRSTPAEVVEVLNKAVNAGLADPKLNARLADLGSVPLPGQPAAFGKLIADETEKMGQSNQVRRHQVTVTHRPHQSRNDENRRGRSFRGWDDPAYCARPLARFPHACGVGRFCAIALDSVIRVPPCPSLAVANEEAMYCPSSARLAVWVPSLTVSVPPLLSLFIQ